MSKHKGPRTRLSSSYYNSPWLERMEDRRVLAGDNLGDPSISDLALPDAAAREQARVEFIERYQHDDLQSPDPIPNWWSTDQLESSDTIQATAVARTAPELTTFAVQAAASQDYTDLTGFPLYDSLLYDNKPDLSATGLRPIQLLTSSFFWTPQELSNGSVYSDANLNRVREFTALLSADQYAVIDIETWPTRGTEAVVAESIRKFDAVIDVMREVNPLLKIGIYSLMPAREYWVPVLNDNETTDFKAWESINARLDELAAKVDVIFPSIYTFYPDYEENGAPRLYERDWWVEYAVENLLQARRYNKPTVAFIWPRYHGGGGTENPNSPDFRYWKYQPIGSEFWNLILDTTSKYADGAVLFDYEWLAGKGETVPRPWLDDAPWWTATQEFINPDLSESANSEVKVFGGPVEGTYLDTAKADGQSQILSEVRFGAVNRYRVEHKWTFNVDSEATEFTVEGYHNSARETFSFEYSTNGTTFVPMGISLTTSLQERRFAFPAGITGQITVRLKDSNRLTTDTIGDKVYLDRMAIWKKPVVDSSLPTISVQDTSVQEGSESQATFVVRRTGDLSKSTTLSYYTQDESSKSPDDYTSRSPRTLYFGPYISERTVSIPIADDELFEPNETFALQLQGAIGGVLLDDRGIATITDNDQPPPPPPFQSKFFVVDANVMDTFPYDAAGTAGTPFDLTTANASPRGITSFDGSFLWVVDRTANVYVYNATGSLVGTWRAGGIIGASGIATNGTDIWIVDDLIRRVVKFAGAANNPNTPANDPILSGYVNLNSLFVLNPLNAVPTDLTTDGASIWVVDDGGGVDRVFEYNLSGTMLRNWALVTENSKPTGITVDPSGVSDSLWVVDSRSLKVYEYAAVGGNQNRQVAASFKLAAGNVNPQGIADPPPSVVTNSQSTVWMDPSLIGFALLPNNSPTGSRTGDLLTAAESESEPVLPTMNLESVDGVRSPVALLDSQPATDIAETRSSDMLPTDELVGELATWRDSRIDASAFDLAMMPHEFAQLQLEFMLERSRRSITRNRE